MIGEGGVAAYDFANNEEDVAAESENNEDLEHANAEGSNEVYISCIKFISINSMTQFLISGGARIEIYLWRSYFY
jgi:hypothetical protein